MFWKWAAADKLIEGKDNSVALAVWLIVGKIWAIVCDWVNDNWERCKEIYCKGYWYRKGSQEHRNQRKTERENRGFEPELSQIKEKAGEDNLSDQCGG